MNRYMAEGMLRDMRAGKRVLYLAPTLTFATHALNYMSALAQPSESVTRTHGNESIRQVDGPGLIRFKSIGSSVRGLSADVVAIEGDPSIRQMQEVEPVLARSGGELIRA